MNSEQADSAADAVMQEAHAKQHAAAGILAKQERLSSAHRRAAIYGLVGFAAGALAGYVIFPKVFPAAIIGMGLGSVFGRWFVGRKD
ncbi:MAG: hypothetical protein ABI114_00045 [Rhodanobacter sp.]